jgi:hypothetical protein
MGRYTIKDVQTGHVFCSHDDYDRMAYTFFHIEDHVYGGRDHAEYLTMVDTTTGRGVSIVLREDWHD